MSEPPRKPLEARKRLPFEQKLDQEGQGLRKRLRAFLYLAVAVVCLALAGYMNVVNAQPVAAPQVFVPALGGIYFALRAAMTFFAVK